MGFMEHLEELRKRIIWMIAFIAGGFCVCYYWHNELRSWLEGPLNFALQHNKLPGNLVYTNPTDAFNMDLKVSLIAGIFVASPFVLYQVWAFIAPGLYRNERRYVGPFLFSTVGLFVAGGFFAYKMVFPAALDFLIDYSRPFTPMVTVNEYIDLFMTIIIGLGVVFEMPILVFFLALFGIISPGWMWRNFRYSILVIFIIAAVITPTTDIMNMCIFAAPMIVLYLGSILVAWMVHPKYRKKRALESK